VLLLTINCATMTEKITRFGVSIEPELLKNFDKIIKKEGYSNRSEKIRDLIRKNLINQEIKDPNSEVIGTLTMIYDHHTGNLTNKLLDLQHDHHSEILTTTHVHIDHNNCLEVLVLEGKTKNIQKLSDNIRALKGIKHGELVITKSSN
jgi:CopG family transcriptional regulator, nickel-responsive regulator